MIQKIYNIFFMDQHWVLIPAPIIGAHNKIMRTPFYTGNTIKSG